MLRRSSRRLTYDANGNMIDPASAPLAIGPDGAPIDAAAGLYFDEVGNLIDPATGMAVSYDANGQPVVQGRRSRRTGRSPEASPPPRRNLERTSRATTPWLAPPPSGPPPGYKLGATVHGLHPGNWSSRRRRLSR